MLSKPVADATAPLKQATMTNIPSYGPLCVLPVPCGKQDRRIHMSLSSTLLKVALPQAGQVDQKQQSTPFLCLNQGKRFCVLTMMTTRLPMPNPTHTKSAPSNSQYRELHLGHRGQPSRPFQPLVRTLDIRCVTRRHGRWEKREFIVQPFH